MTATAVSWILGAGILAVAPAVAHDRFEGTPQFNVNDDDPALTANELRHGHVQRHDLQGTVATPDVDHMIVNRKQRHSYEARLFTQSERLDTNTVAACATCAHFDLLDTAGAVVQESERADGEVGVNVIRFEHAAADVAGWLRVTGSTANGDLDANDIYDVEFLDTTYFAPRWNNAAGQVTVFVIRSTREATVTGNVYFYDPAGTLLHTQPLSVGPDELQTINTSTIPALAGQSGSAAIAHLGGFGALSGKAVALDPATGFSFDTPFNHIAR